MKWYSVKHLDQNGGVWVGFATFCIIVLWYLDSLGFVTVNEWVPSCYKFILGAFAITKPAKALIAKRTEK